MQPIYYITAASALLFLTSLAGFAVTSFNSQFSGRYLTAFLGFSAGTLAGSSLSHFFPLIFEASGNEKFEIALWFGAGILFDVIIALITHTKKSEEKFAYMLIPGDLIHNAATSVIICGVLYTDLTLGISALLMTLLHEIPHKTGNFGVLLFAGLKKSKALFWSLFTGIFFFTGIFVLYFTNLKLNTAPVLAFASGNFIYISLMAMLPVIIKESTKKRLITDLFLFAFGFLIFLTVSILEH